MKKHLIIPVLAALTLASCGGGNSNQNNNSDTTAVATVETPQCDVSTTTANETADTITDTKQCIAYEVLLKYAEKYDYPSKQMVEDQFEGEFKREQLAQDPEFVEASPGDGMMRLHCYPYKNGGYYVLVIFDEVCDCPGAYRYEFFDYKDGNLTKAKSLLPKPTINDFYANADKFPKDIFNILKPRATGNVFHYYDYDSHKLTASFEGFEWDGGYDVPAPLKKYYEAKEASFPSITYIWDGEKFIRDPECEPYEEDLSLFGEEVSDAEFNPYNMKQHLAELPNTYTTDSVYFALIEIDGSDDNYDRVIINAFPYKNGGYLLVAEHSQRVWEGDLTEYETYNYKDGKLAEVDGVLPVPALAEFLDSKKCEGHDNDVKKITELYNKGAAKYIYYNAGGKQLLYTRCHPQLENLTSDDWVSDYDSLMKDDRFLPIFKWNGEKFIKQ